MNLTEYFYQNWLDKLVTIIGVIIGIVTAVGILISKITESIKSFKVCTDTVKETGDELEKTNTNTRELNVMFTKSLATLKESTETTDKLNQNYNELNEKFTKELDTIKQVLLIAFTTDPELVKRGYANEIAKLVKGEQNGDTSEEQI